MPRQKRRSSISDFLSRSSYWRIHKEHEEENTEKEQSLDSDKELEDYVDEMHKAFWLPHSCKWVAWFTAMTAIFTCAVILVLYGMSFGTVRSELWLTSVFTSEGISMFITQPFKAVVLAFISSYVLKLEYHIYHRPVTPDMLKNLPDNKKKTRVLEFRRERKACYNPPDPATMRKRKLQLRNIQQMDNLLFDISWHVAFMLILYVLIGSQRSPHYYYGHETAVKLVVHANYTNSIPLLRVVTYQQFLEYINETLVPAVMADNNLFQTRRDAGQLVRMVDRANTLDPHIKLMGKPRLRQKRVKKDSCKVHKSMKVTVSGSCSAELTWANEDTKDYNIGWETESDGPMLDRGPWIYRSSWENKAMLAYMNRLSDISSGGGGYVFPLGKNAENSQMVLKNIDYFNWVDPNTRQVYLDLVLYSLNSNLLHIVTLLFEFSASGTVVPSYEIRTDQFLSDGLSQLTLTVVGTVLFFVIVFFSAIVECFRIRTISIKTYFTEGWTCLDLLIIIFGLSSVLFLGARAIMMTYLLEELDSAAANDYVSFEYVGFLSSIANFNIGFTVFLATMKTLRLLTFQVVFYEWERTLRMLWPMFQAVFIVVLFVIIIFAMHFHLIIGKYEERWSSIITSISLLLTHSIGRHDDFDVSSLYRVPPPLGSLIYALFVFLTSLILVNGLTTAIAVHLRCIQTQPLKSNFQVLTYLKSLIDHSVEMPGPADDPAPPEPMVLKRKVVNVVPPQYLDQVRLEGLKRIAIQVLTGRDYKEETALNITQLVLSGNSKRNGTDRYYIRRWKDSTYLVGEKTLTKMKDIADIVVIQRNQELKKLIEEGKSVGSAINRD